MTISTSRNKNIES